MISISEIVNVVQQFGAGALLIAKNYILGLIWRNDSIYLFDSHSKDENGNLSSFVTAVLLNFDALYSLEKYVRSVCYNTFFLTLYFQVQFIKVHCTAIASYELKKQRLSARPEEDLLAKKRKYRDNPERKKRQLKRDMMIWANQ